jgi:hypothetical protein
MIGPVQPLPDTPLPDTPPWSARRLGAVAALFLAGALLAGSGALSPGGDDIRCLRLIDTGAEMMILAVGAYVTGASAERAAGWLGLRRAPQTGGGGP